MTAAGRLLTIAIIVLVAFVVGLLIGEVRLRDARGQAEAARTEARELRDQLELSELRDLSGLMFMETFRHNYGLAANHSRRYFQRVEDVLQRTDDPQLRRALEQIAGRRDSITAGLARGEAAVLQDVQALYQDTYRVTRREDPGQFAASPVPLR
jgi:uncharacterized membrane protein